MGQRLGQHFLVRSSLLERIAVAACPEPTQLVIEIGPGRGALTDHLLQHAQRVIAIEIDPVLTQYLRQKYRDQPRLEIVEADILKADLSQYGRFTVAGNLPYYITSPIVEKTLGMRPAIERAVFLVQKEVAIRMTSGPGSRDYGYLSVSTQLFADARVLFHIAPGAFRPPPKIESTVIALIPKPDLPVEDPARFLRFVGRCFLHKRKTLRNNLQGSYDSAKIEQHPYAKKRAEELSIAQLIELYSYLT